jgi:integrase
MSAALITTKTKGVYKRGNRYCYVFRGPDGKQRRRAAKTYKEAVRRKAAVTIDVDRGEWMDSRVTFADYAPQWIATYKGRTKRGINSDTKGDYRRLLGLDENGEPLLDEDGMATGALAYFGRMRLGHVRPPDIKGYVAELEARGLAANTVRLAVAPVRALFGTAFDDGLIRANPAAGVRVVVQSEHEEEEEQAKALTEEELAAFLTVLEADSEGKGWGEWRPFFDFLAQTGLRIGEAIELRWGDVEGSWLRINRRYYRGRVALPKGRKRRSVPLSRELAQALWTLRKERHASDEELVWTSHAGQRVDQSNVMSRVLKPAARKAGIGEWPGFHAFRHTAATRLFRRGWNAVQVQRFLGHSDPGFTLRT